MTGIRKFLMTMTALVAFTAITILSSYQMDPVALGLGILLILSPPSAANAIEHLAKKK